MAGGPEWHAFPLTQVLPNNANVGNSITIAATPIDDVDVPQTGMEHYESVIVVGSDGRVYRNRLSWDWVNGGFSWDGWVDLSNAVQLFNADTASDSLAASFFPVPNQPGRSHVTTYVRSSGVTGQAWTHDPMNAWVDMGFGGSLFFGQSWAQRDLPMLANKDEVHGLCTAGATTPNIGIARLTRTWGMTDFAWPYILPP